MHAVRAAAILSVLAIIQLISAKPVLAVPHNPHVGIDVDSRLVTSDMVDYLANFGFGYVRMQVAAEDLVSDDEENLAVLYAVKRRCDVNRIKLYLVLESRTLNSEVIRDACERIRGLPGGQPWAVQLFDDINLRKGFAVDRYANLLRVAATELNQPDGHYLLCGGIKGADFDYFKRLAKTDVLELVDAVTINVFPPADGIELETEAHITPRSDLPVFLEYIGFVSSFGKEVWVGELGIANSLTGFGVDSFSQASILPRAALILLAEGVTRVTMFTALDPPATDEAVEDGRVILRFGMIPASLRPRPWGWAMRNLNILTAELVPSWFGPSISWAPEFPATGDTIYHVWLESDEYITLCYWTANPSSIDRRTGIVIYDETLKPAIYQNILSEKAHSVESNSALNMVVVGDLPLSTIPTVLVFEKLRGDGVSSQ
ncbi:hypothetical protein J7K50_06380 [bacterium]|nr:hypothetical protein [bacterium]